MIVCADADALAREGARHVAAAAGRAIESRGRFTLVLSGGSTPRRLHEALAEEDVSWSDVHVLFGDERCVPPDDPASNYRAAREALLDLVTAGTVRRIEGELPPEVAAARYEAEIAAVPRLDLVLLGMGTDGHTASLFPGGPELLEARRVVASRAPVPPLNRVTLTFPPINSAREVVFLVSGEGKAEVLAEVLEGSDLPAGRVRPEGGELLWLVDREAAGKLPEERRAG